MEYGAVGILPPFTEIGKASVTIHDAGLLWCKTSLIPALININFISKKGDLSCIIGKVGSGKSAILQALLGNLCKIKGDVFVSESLAYVPQVSWIMNGIVKENIVFGYKFDPIFYEITLRTCALLSDLDCLPHGDETQVGERGISLSAVDEHVGKYILSKMY